MNRKTDLLIRLLSLTLTLLLISCNQETDKQSLSQIEQWYAGYPLYEVYTRSVTAEGTFEALQATLPELQSMGINNIWLMPIHPVGEVGRKGSWGCPYSVKDYFAVGEEYGTIEDFKHLVDTAHQMDVRVIIDMVINHSANDHIEMSNHPDWYFRDSTGAFSREVADWWDITDWNFGNPEAWDYLESVLTYWVKEYDVDGYRCDVAGMVPDAFWQRVIPKLRDLNPDIFMLAEWETPQMTVNGFNADYDWSLYHGMVAHHKEEITLDELWQRIEDREQNWPDGFLPLRFVENHDQERAYAVFGESYKPYAALIFTLPGIPLLYNGQEIGADHKPSLFEKETIDWMDVNDEVKMYYQALLELRNGHTALREDSLKRLQIEPADKLMAFERPSDKGTVIVYINFSDEMVDVDISREIGDKYRLWDKDLKITGTIHMEELSYLVLVEE